MDLSKRHIFCLLIRQLHPAIAKVKNFYSTRLDPLMQKSTEKYAAPTLKSRTVRKGTLLKYIEDMECKKLFHLFFL